MFERILWEMRARVRAGHLAMTIHAIEEMMADELTLEDLKRCILKGAIIERQEDDSPPEYKYVIQGQTLDPEELIHVVAKLGKKNTVVITTYRVF